MPADPMPATRCVWPWTLGALLALGGAALSASEPAARVPASLPSQLGVRLPPAPAPAPEPVVAFTSQATCATGLGAVGSVRCVRDERRPCAQPWRFTLALPVWVPSTAGSVSSGSTRVEAGHGANWSPLGWVDDLDLAETATSVDFFFVGGLEARRGRWTLGVEVEHADLGATLDWTVADAAVDGSFSATIARAYAGYELGRGRPFGCGPELSWGPYLGARYYAVRAAAQGALVDFDRSAAWLDPTLGLDANLVFGNGARLHLAADVGGILVGSDFSWSATAELVWPLSRRWALAVGWSWHQFDYEEGPAADRFGFDLRLSGPRFALMFAF